MIYLRVEEIFLNFEFCYFLADPIVDGLKLQDCDETKQTPTPTEARGSKETITDEVTTSTANTNSKPSELNRSLSAIGQLPFDESSKHSSLFSLYF